MGGEHPPTQPRYEPDGSGRDTYIRRDPHTVYGKSLYTEAKQIPTRFGDAGSATSHSKHTGYCGYTLGGRDPGSADYDEGFGGRVGGAGGGGLKVVQAQYLMPVPPAFEVEVKHFSTMKDILLDRMASLSPGGIPVGSQGPVDERGFPQNRGHISGYSGFQPRCMTMADGKQGWANLNQLNAARPEDRPGAEEYPPPYGIKEVGVAGGMQTGRGGLSVITGVGPGGVLA